MDPEHYQGLRRAPGPRALAACPPQWDPAYAGLGKVPVRDHSMDSALV